MDVHIENSMQDEPTDIVEEAQTPRQGFPFRTAPIFVATFCCPRLLAVPDDGGPTRFVTTADRRMHWTVFVLRGRCFVGWSCMSCGAEFSVAQLCDEAFTTMTFCPTRGRARIFFVDLLHRTEGFACGCISDDGEVPTLFAGCHWRSRPLTVSTTDDVCIDVDDDHGEESIEVLSSSHSDEVEMVEDQGDVSEELASLRRIHRDAEVFDELRDLEELLLNVLVSDEAP